MGVIEECTGIRQPHGVSGVSLEVVPGEILGVVGPADAQIYADKGNHEGACLQMAISCLTIHCVLFTK